MMKRTLSTITAIIIFYNLVVLSTVADENTGFLKCILEANSVSCARKRIAREVDEIEVEVTGKRSDVPVSVVLEETGNFVVNGLSSLFGSEKANNTLNYQSESREVEEARKKKFGKKKKKKLLMKLIPLALLLKSKLSFLLQLISTKLQLKFFVIAVISLIINIARFWIDLKKKQEPSKVFYYEHAQHQHHYDHDDDHSFWGRSVDASAHNLAYNAHAPS